MNVQIPAVVKVGIADVQLVKSPDRIRTSGLGSCVGLVLFDQDKRLAGLVHVMLPDSSLSKGAVENLAKYADTGVKHTIDLLLKAGARKHALKAKLAGGAEMFKFKSTNDLMRIGPRNVSAVKNICLFIISRLLVRIQAETVAVQLNSIRLRQSLRSVL